VFASGLPSAKLPPGSNL